MTTAMVVAVSCQRDVVYNDTFNKPIVAEEQVSPYAVSEEVALERLDAELVLLYGDDTRVRQRSISNIKPIKFENISCTRASDLDVDNLLYIVEFENGEGSAILGADERVEAVFAVLEDGIITVDDFNNAAIGIEDGKLTTYLAELIADEAIEQVQTSSLGGGLPDVDFRVSYYEYENIITESRDCHIRTKWGQGSPYNMYCYNEDGELCVAGCVTIAAAQVLLYNPVPNVYDIVIDGEVFNRSLLNLKVHDNDDLPLKQLLNINHEVAKYVAKLADALDVKLRPTTSTASSREIDTLMRDMGYANVNYVSGRNLTFEDDVRDQLYVRGLPAPFRGGRVNSDTGHAWVLDGYKYQCDDQYWVTKEGNLIISKEYRGQRKIQKVHCNYGWNGLCDGYYSYGIFDTTNQLNSEDIITDTGDRPGTTEYNYSIDFAMVSYEMP